MVRRRERRPALSCAAARRTRPARSTTLRRTLLAIATVVAILATAALMSCGGGGDDAAGSEYAVEWEGALPASMAAGKTTNVDLKVTNRGTKTWAAAGKSMVRVRYRWYDGECVAKGAKGKQLAVSDGASLPKDVPSGASVTVSAVATEAPALAGSYCLVYDLHERGVAWFGVKGAAVLQQTVAVIAP